MSLPKRPEYMVKNEHSCDQCNKSRQWNEIFFTDVVLNTLKQTRVSEVVLGRNRLLESRTHYSDTVVIKSSEKPHRLQFYRQ